MKAKSAMAVVVGLAGVGIAALPATPAAAQTRQQFAGTFTTEEPGASTGYRFSIDYVNPDDPERKPYAVQQIVQTLHAGARIDTSVPPRCEATNAELIAQGPAACPASTRVGSGEVTVDSGMAAGPMPRLIKNRLTFFNADSELVVLTESTNTPGPPIRTANRVAVGERTLTLQVPPIPAFPPPDPFLANKRARVVLDPISVAGRSFISTPPSCPLAGAWTNRATFTYRDGVSQTVLSDSPCRGSSVAAAASYRPGFYEAGTPKGRATLHWYAGVNVKRGAFSVRRISVIARCEDGKNHEWHFIRGTRVQIKGRISSTGRFSGSYEEFGGYFKVRGRVEGRRARMTVTMLSGRGSTDRSERCRSEHTFRLKRVSSPSPGGGIPT
jgi:hypothetical protein